jgi:hypothetical protein
MKRALVVFSAFAACIFTAREARASCTATVNCDVTVIQCSGQSVCQSGANWVQCDSQSTIYCPVCQAQVTCCDGRFLYCNGYTSCQEYPNRIVCDGQTRGICPDCREAFSGHPDAPADKSFLEGLAEPQKGGR